ncbi:MAG: M23 family metallopeptidase [Clostridia bacterium]|nr:M23 family metallopeptidase [Clostridia bacterium]
MNYNETRFTKFIGSTGFYALIASCIIAIGAISWFAVSGYNKNRSIGELNSPNGVYSLPGDAYTDSKDDFSEVVPEPVESANNIVSDEPYSEPEEPVAPIAESFIFPVEGEIIKDFSRAQLQYSATYSDMRLHKGIDLACEKDSPVKSSGEGTVKSVEENATLGTVVTIDHGNGIEFRYCGLKDVTVASGATVKQGEVICNISEVPSECADQGHLHLEVYKNNEAVSPSDIINS